MRARRWRMVMAFLPCSSAHADARQTITRRHENTSGYDTERRAMRNEFGSADSEACACAKLTARHPRDLVSAQQVLPTTKTDAPKASHGTHCWTCGHRTGQHGRGWRLAMESIFSRSSCVKGPFFFQIGTCSHHTTATPQQTCDKTSSSL